MRNVLTCEDLSSITSMEYDIYMLEGATLLISDSLVITEPYGLLEVIWEHKTNHFTQQGVCNKGSQMRIHLLKVDLA